MITTPSVFFPECLCTLERIFICTDVIVCWPESFSLVVLSEIEVCIMMYGVLCVLWTRGRGRERGGEEEGEGERGNRPCHTLGTGMCLRKGWGGGVGYYPHLPPIHHTR